MKIKRDRKLDALLQWFDRSPLGMTLERNALLAEQQLRACIDAYERYETARARERETPALLAALREAEDEYRQAVGAAARKVSAARRALDRHTQQISHDKSRAEIVLRQTSDPVISETSDTLWRLFDARAHAMTHCTSEAERSREAVAAARRPGEEPPKMCLTALRDHEHGERMAAEYSESIEAIRRLQLEMADDLPAAVAEITKDLPTRCECCDRKLTLRLSHVQTAKGRAADIIAPGAL